MIPVSLHFATVCMFPSFSWVHLVEEDILRGGNFRSSPKASSPELVVLLVP